MKYTLKKIKLNRILELPVVFSEGYIPLDTSPDGMVWCSLINTSTVFVTNGIIHLDHIIHVDGKGNTTAEKYQLRKELD